MLWRMDDSTETPRAALDVAFRPIDGLIPYARNSRTHSDAQVAQLAGAIAEYGWTNPILADDKGIVAGHGRVMAARKLYDAGQTIRLPNGLALPANTVPVIDCSGWSDAQRRAYVIADNAIALNAGWDKELLKVELGELKTLGFDLPLVGFDETTLATLLAGPDAAASEAGEDESGDAEDDATRIINCPKCGHDFSVLEQMTKQARRRKKSATP